MKKVSAKKLRELLADVRAHTENQLFKPVLPAPPVISYQPANRHQRARWVVTRVGYKTDPEHGHFLDGHNKIFRVDGVTPKEPARVLAIDWASEEYGYTTAEWAKTPFGSWVPKVALETALRHYLPELFGESTSTGDPVVKRITDKLYGEDPEWAESTPEVKPTGRSAGNTGESIRRAFDFLKGESRTDESLKVDVSSVDADGWYRVVGANVAVFIQATSEHDAKTRVELMINRMTMNCTLSLHITKRDPEVG